LTLEVTLLLLSTYFCVGRLVPSSVAIADDSIMSFRSFLPADSLRSPRPKHLIFLYLQYSFILSFSQQLLRRLSPALRPSSLRAFVFLATGLIPFQPQRSVYHRGRIAAFHVQALCSAHLTFVLRFSSHLSLRVLFPSRISLFSRHCPSVRCFCSFVSRSSFPHSYISLLSCCLFGSESSTSS